MQGLSQNGLLFPVRDIDHTRFISRRQGRTVAGLGEGTYKEHLKHKGNLVWRRYTDWRHLMYKCDTKGEISCSPH